MPNRIIRESALTSHSLAKLSDGAERLFWRLTVSADDHGRFDAHPVTVKAKCFPTLVDTLKTSKVCSWLAELSIDHCLFYTVEGRTYGQFRNWAEYQRTYNLKSKFPEPPADCGESPQTPALIRESISENRESRIENSAVPEDDGTAARFQEFWQAYPARNGKKLEKAVTESRFQKLSPADQALAVRAARNYADSLRGQEISAKDPKRFFRDEYWRDWITEAQLTPIIQKRKILDPPPKAYLPAPVIDLSKAEPCPPELVETMRRLGVTM